MPGNFWDLTNFVWARARGQSPLSRAAWPMDGQRKSSLVSF